MCLPIPIQNKMGKKAVLELNNKEYIVCKYANGENYYLNDVDIEGWYPANKLRYFIYKIRNLIS